MKIPAIPGFDQQAFEKYFKNTGWLMIARVGSLAIKMLINSFALASYLGASDFGIYTYPTVIVTFFMAAAALGLDGFVTRELLHQPEKKNVLLGTSFYSRLTGGVIAIPLIFITYKILYHIHPIETPLEYVMIVGLSCMVQSVNIIDSYFQSRVQGKYIMYVQVMGNLFSAIIKLLFILFQLPLIWFIYSVVIDSVLLASGYILFYRKDGNKLSEWKFNSKTAGYLLKRSWPLAFSAILITIYMKIDQLMIETYMGSKALGIYSTVVNLSESWYFIPVAIVTSVFPAIMNARKTDPKRYLKRLQNLYDLMVVISLSIAIIMSFASTLIYHIAYGPEFLTGAPVLAVHVWAGIFVFLGTASGQYLIAEGYTSIAMIRTGAGAVLNILLNLIWIPQYGILGAAYATLVAYATATFFILLIPSTRRQGILMLKSLFLISLIQNLIKR